MRVLRRHIGTWLLVICSLILLLSACSALNPAAGEIVPVAKLRPGTILWSYQGASNVFTAAWSPDGKRLAIAGSDSTASGEQGHPSLSRWEGQYHERQQTLFRTRATCR
jgi:hypothetical protein